MIDLDLTIAMPTYNAASNVDAQLGLISKWRNKYRFVCVVLDNDSNDSTRLIVEKYDWVEYLCQDYNKGADYNIYSAFVTCNTNYLWILSTNDVPKADALDIISGDLSARYGFINYASRSKEIIVNSFREFCESDISYTRAFFISQCIYNVGLLQSVLYEYKKYISTQNGQLILVMKYLEHSLQSKYFFSTDSLIKSETEASWSKLEFVNNSMGLMDVFRGKNGKIFDRYFARKIVYVWLIFLREEREKGVVNRIQCLKIFVAILKKAPIVSFLDKSVLFRSIKLLLN